MTHIRAKIAKASSKGPSPLSAAMVALASQVGLVCHDAPYANRRLGRADAHSPRSAAAERARPAVRALIQKPLYPISQTGPLRAAFTSARPSGRQQAHGCPRREPPGWCRPRSGSQAAVTALVRTGARRTGRTWLAWYSSMRPCTTSLASSNSAKLSSNIFVCL
jgi:hypothetical protein